MSNICVLSVRRALVIGTLIATCAIATPLFSQHEVMVERSLNSVVKVLPFDYSVHGSGFVVSPTKIVTNAHVVSGGMSLGYMVQTRDGQRDVVIDIDYHPSSDIAVLTVGNPVSATPLKLVADRPLQSAEVFVLGHPFAFDWSVTRGVVSADRDDLLQIDAAMNGGNSGGPVLNKQGSVIGVSVLKVTHDMNNSRLDGLGFCVPADVVCSFLESLSVDACFAYVDVPSIRTSAQCDSLQEVYREVNLAKQRLAEDRARFEANRRDAGTLVQRADSIRASLKILTNEMQQQSAELEEQRREVDKKRQELRFLEEEIKGKRSIAYTPRFTPELFAGLGYVGITDPGRGDALGVRGEACLSYRFGARTSSPDRFGVYGGVHWYERLDVKTSAQQPTVDVGVLLDIDEIVRLQIGIGQNDDRQVGHPNYIFAAATAWVTDGTFPVGFRLHALSYNDRSMFKYGISCIVGLRADVLRW